MNAAGQTLLIRADATTQKGTGHIMRCLALAQAWQAFGGTVHFLCAAIPPALESRLLNEGMKLSLLATLAGSADDVKQTIAIARSMEAKWVVVDGYEFDDSYQQAIKEAGLSLLFIDDYGHAAYYWADIVLNQNVYAQEALYSHRAAYTQLLLGSTYVLLRREFWSWHQRWQRDIADIAKKILVTLGGGDADNVTLKVIEALKQLPTGTFEAIVVLGEGNPHYKELNRAVESNSFVQLKENVINMPELMNWADMAVSAAGSTSWELAYTGLPALLLTVSDNQIPIAEYLHTKKVLINLGKCNTLTAADIKTQLETLSLSPNCRSEMSRSGQLLVDGLGSRRVIKMMGLENEIRLIEACSLHSQLLWQWANDPEVRAVSFSPEPIPWEQHISWFAAKLLDPNCLLYLAVDANDTPIGQVRFDLAGEKAIISISIDSASRGKGYGSKMIALASQRLFQEKSLTQIYAYVKEDNKASYHAFTKAGFKERGKVNIKGQEALLLVWEPIVE